MVQPDTLPSTPVVYRWLGPALTSPDEENGWALLLILDALMGQQEPVERVVRHRDGRVGWETALDPETAPAETLEWLAQWVGVRLDPRWSVADQRAAIANPLSWRRGTVESIRIAARAWLGSGDVTVTERDPGEWDIKIEYDADQVGGATLDDLDAQYVSLDALGDGVARLQDLNGDAAALEAAVIAATPAWLVPTLVQNP